MLNAFTTARLTTRQLQLDGVEVTETPDQCAALKPRVTQIPT